MKNLPIQQQRNTETQSFIRESFILKTEEYLYPSENWEWYLWISIECYHRRVHTYFLINTLIVRSCHFTDSNLCVLEDAIPHIIILFYFLEICGRLVVMTPCWVLCNKILQDRYSNKNKGSSHRTCCRVILFKSFTLQRIFLRRGNSNPLGLYITYRNFLGAVNTKNTVYLSCVFSCILMRLLCSSRKGDFHVIYATWKLKIDEITFSENDF